MAAVLGATLAQRGAVGEGGKGGRPAAKVEAAMLLNGADIAILSHYLAHMTSWPLHKEVDGGAEVSLAARRGRAVRNVTAMLHGA